MWKYKKYELGYKFNYHETGPAAYAGASVAGATASGAATYAAAATSTPTANSNNNSSGSLTDFNVDTSVLQPHVDNVKGVISRVSQTPDFLSLSKASFPEFTQNKAEEIYDIAGLSSLAEQIETHLRELINWYETTLAEIIQKDEELAEENNTTPVDDDTTGTGTSTEENPTDPEDDDTKTTPESEPTERETEASSEPSDDGEGPTDPPYKGDDDEPTNDDDTPTNDDDGPSHDDDGPSHDDDGPSHDDDGPSHDDDHPTEPKTKPSTPTEPKTTPRTTPGGGGGGGGSTSPSVAADAIKKAAELNQSNAAKKGLSLDANTPRLTSNIINSQGQKNFAARSLAGAGIALGVAGITGGLFLAKGKYYTFTPEDWDDTEPEVQEAILNNFMEAGMSDSEIEEFKNSTFKIEMKELNEHIKKVEFAYAANEAVADEFYNMYHFTIFDEDGDVDKYLLFLVMGIDGMFPNADVNFYNIINPYLEEDDINFIYTGINLADYIYDAGEEDIEDEEVEEEEETVI